MVPAAKIGNLLFVYWNINQIRSPFLSFSLNIHLLELYAYFKKISILIISKNRSGYWLP